MLGILSRPRRERIPPLELAGGNGATLDMGGTLGLLLSGDGMSGNFLTCSKGVKDPLEVPEFKCDYPLVASAEMGLISPGGENLLDFLELRQVLSAYDVDLRDALWWPQERPVPMRVARGPLRIPLPSMPRPKTFCGVGSGT